MQLDYLDATAILEQSTILYKEVELLTRIKSLAQTIEKEIVGDIPLFLNVMNGSVFFCAELLKHIRSPILLDYVHATRYNNSTTGLKNITWHHTPLNADIRGKNVYVIDDILDEGHTLAEIRNFLIEAGAKTCNIVVLIDKNLEKPKPINADFVGFTAPHKYLFGYGMDIFGLYRQLPDIYVYNK